jgi:SNF2 family DNA or RNA helicase
METFKKWLVECGKDVLDHQVDGMRWILERETRKVGGIVADEMGLGKTTLAMGTIITQLKTQPDSRSLIVVPTSILFQWYETFKRDLGHTPYVHHASIKNTKSLSDSPIVLTTYGMVSVSEEREEKFRSGEVKSLTPIHKTPWDRVIYDEAHNLKSDKTAKFRGAYRLRAGVTWLYTGTPVQIRITEVRSLLRLLGYEERIKKDHLKDHLNHVMLRRTRADIDQPMRPIHTHFHEVDFEGTRNDFVYETGMELPFGVTDCEICGSPFEDGNRLVKFSCNHTFCLECATQWHDHMSHTTGNPTCAKCRGPTEMVSDSSEDKAYRKFETYYRDLDEGATTSVFDKINKHSHLVPIIRMRQMTTMPKTLTKVVSESVEAAEMATGDDEVDARTKSDAEILQNAILKSSKVDEVINVVRDVGETKTLIFTHFRAEVDTYTSLLTEAGYITAFIDSRVPLRLRKEILDADSPFQVVVMQMRTSCDGLNLKHFHNIVFTSPSYNHGATKQAIARANRIDSDHDVNVHFVLFRNTYEMKLADAFKTYCDEY